MTSNNNNHKPGPPAPMSCSEFQEKLPDLFAAGNGELPDDAALHEHLQTCENCAALVRDLQYIAEQASLLLQPVEEEPSDNVWKKIKESLEIESTQEPAVNGEVS